MFAEVNNIQIYYDIHGEGEPLLLIPGGPGSNHVNYERHHLSLSEYNQLILFDPRGCGKSTKTSIDTYEIEQYVEDVEALRQFFGFKKWNVLGKSHGGVVAQAYVLKYPENIDKLILVATTPSFRFVELAKKNLKKMGTNEQIDIGMKLLEGGFTAQQEVDKAIEILNPLYSNKGSLIESIPATNNHGEEKPSIALGPLMHAFKTYMHTFNFEPELHKIKNKTLIIAGDHDWVCDPSLSTLMSEKIPNSILKVLNAGHLMDQDQPEIYIETIKQFLSFYSD